jgi:MFS superfamily sulfate permease-like transporter
MKNQETTEKTPPIGNLDGLRQYWQNDLLSGFLVSIIALPLCLGIANASSAPPIAGIFTAILGGLLCPLFSNSEMTIKGPAAGMIVIMLGCITDLGFECALAVGVIAGIIQILFGFLKLGKWGDFFPVAAVHGMLAAIGVIIFSKQVHLMLGVIPSVKEPLELIELIPHSLKNINQSVAVIGFLSLALLVIQRTVKATWVKIIPAQVIILFASAALASYYGLQMMNPKYMVSIPNNLLQGFAFPHFDQVFTLTSLKWIVMYALVGSLESLLSAKSVDLIDPYQRRSNLNKDIIAVGVANTLSSCIGGLPMISEIIRSSANINNGAKTRWSNFFHGFFLLSLVVTVPFLLNRIPIAALAAMLVFTGYNLASPKEFKHLWHIGKFDFIVFITTLIITLATDLLVGIAAGVICNMILNLSIGAPIKRLFSIHYELSLDDNNQTHVPKISLTGAATFSNWLTFQKRLDQLQHLTNLHIDVSKLKLIDHSFLSKMDELKKEWKLNSKNLVIVGLNQLTPLSECTTATHIQRK